MSVDPIKMLEKLRAEQTPVEQASVEQPSEGGQDPMAHLQQLRAEGVKPAPEKQVKEKKGILKGIFDYINEAVPTTQAGVAKFVSKAFIDDDGAIRDIEETPIKEGVKRIKGSTEAIEQGLKEAGQGAVQMTFAGMEKSGLAPKGLTEYYTKLSDKQRKEFESEFKSRFGDSANYAFSRGVGKMGPVLVVGPLAAAKSVTGQIAATTAFSAGVGATEYIPENAEEERWVNSLQGAGLGFLLSAGANVAPAMKNWLRNKIGGISLKTNVAKKGLDLSQRTGVDLKLSQVTDDPLAAELEQVVRSGGLKMEAERIARTGEGEQLRKTLAYWRKTVSSIKGTTGKVGDRLEAAFKKTLGDPSKKTGLLGMRSKDAEADFNAAHKAAGGKRTIAISEFKKNAHALISQYRNSVSEEKRLFAKKLIETLKRPDIRSGKVNARRVQDLLETYGSQGAKSGQIWKDVDPQLQQSAAKFLFKGADKDLTSAIKSGINGSKELKMARDNYALNSEKISELRTSALYNMFNGKVPKTNDELAAAISNMKPDRLKSTMGLLRESDPTLHKEMQRFWLEKHIADATKTATLGTGRFDPKGMLKLADNDKLLPLFQDRALRKRVVDGIRISQRVIAHNNQAKGTAGMMMKTAAGIAASRDKTFIARFASDLLLPKAVSGYVLKKEGVDILRTMEKSTNPNVWAGALIKLNSFSKETKEE